MENEPDQTEEHDISDASPLTGNYEILLQYSLGQVNAKKAVKLLHLENEASLADLTLKASLPLPRLSLEETEAMRKRFGDMLDRASIPVPQKPVSAVQRIFKAAKRLVNKRKPS